MRARVTVAAVCAVALAIVACGDSEDAETTATSGTSTSGQPAGQLVGKVELQPVAPDIVRPTYVTQPPENQHLLFVTEQAGRVRVVRDGELIEKPFLSIEKLVNDEGSEQGLFSIAFPPDYRASGRFYLAYTDDDDTVRVEEFRRSRNPARADPDSRRTLITVPHRKPKHNGGLVVFGPDDYLYLGFGDGGTINKPRLRAQKLGTLLGKIARIDPSKPSEGRPYSIPPDNPFVRHPGAREEIFALGLRNPWRFAFDTESRSMSIGDVGRLDVEEINYLPVIEARGANFGWPIFEGNRPLSKRFSINPRYRERNLFGDEPPIEPVLTYPHSRGCSVIGGYTMRDPDLPELEGRYIYSDACTGEIRSFTPDAGGVKGDESLDVFLPPAEGKFGIVSFGRDGAGHIYAVSHSGGVYKLVSAKE